MVKKGIILAAGIGSRLYPLTKSIPKPMLPIVNKPAIDFIVEEALKSGIEEIAIVCNHKEEVLKDYFNDKKYIHFYHQPNTYGTSYALKSAINFIEKGPFALFLGDEIINSPIPCIKQLINSFDITSMDAITGVESVEEKLLKEYNCISFNKNVDGTLTIESIIEKPKDNFLSSYTSIGRYVISGINIIPYLKDLSPYTNQEIPLTNYFSTIAAKKRYSGYIIKGNRFDIGTKDKWLNTNIELSKLLI